MTPLPTIGIGGFIASGKSTIAKEFAARNNYRHIDADAVFNNVVCRNPRFLEALKYWCAGHGTDLWKDGAYNKEDMLLWLHELGQDTSSWAYLSSPAKVLEEFGAFVDYWVLAEVVRQMHSADTPVVIEAAPLLWSQLRYLCDTVYWVQRFDAESMVNGKDAHKRVEAAVFPFALARDSHRDVFVTAGLARYQALRFVGALHMRDVGYCPGHEVLLNNRDNDIEHILTTMEANLRES